MRSPFAVSCNIAIELADFVIAAQQKDLSARRGEETTMGIANGQRNLFRRDYLHREHVRSHFDAMRTAIDIVAEEQSAG